MTVNVTEAIYRARAEGADSVTALSRSVDGLTVSEEKLTRATQASEQGFTRLQAKLDPAMRAHLQYQATVEQVARYEQAGIGTATARAQVIDLATRKYMDQVAALQRATQAQDGYNRAQAAGSVNSSGAVNQRLGVQDDFGGAARAADIAAYGRELDQLRAKYSPLFAMQQQYRATLTELGTALKMGAISENEYAAAKDRTKAAFASQVTAIHQFGVSTGLAKQSMTQLSFQLNDIVSGLAMGQSPFTIMAQQGGQVFQVWQMNRNIFKDVAGVIGGLVSRIVAFLGPIGLMIAGVVALTAGFIAFSRAMKETGPTAEEVLKSHERTIGLVKDAYKDAKKAAGEFAKEAKSVLILQAQQDLINLQKQLMSLVTAANSPRASLDAFGTFQIDENAGPMAAKNITEIKVAFDHLQTTLASGNPDIKAFREELALIAKNNPAVTETVMKILKEGEGLVDIADKVRLAKAALDLLNGNNVKGSRSALGLGDEAGLNSYQQLIQKTKDHIEELKAEALYAGMASHAVAALKLQHDADRAALQAKVKPNQDEIDKLKAQLEAAEKLKAVAAVWADINFTSKTLGLSDGDIQIAEKLKAIYGNDIPAAMASTEAAAMRMNDAMGQARELFTGFGVSIAQDLRAGLGPMEALTNALNKFADKLLDMVMTKLMQQAFGGMIPSNFSSWFAPQPGSPSFIGPVQPTAHSGGIVGEQIGNRYIHPAYYENAPRYHTGGIVGRERAIIAMDDEEVLTRSDPRHRWNGGGMAGAGSSPAISFKQTVINNTDSKVTTSEPRRTSDGGMEIVTMIDKVTAKNLSKPGSDSNKAMSNYGVGHLLTRRG